MHRINVLGSMKCWLNIFLLINNAHLTLASIYNEREYYQRIAFHFRNKWHLKHFDMRIMNWFRGGKLREQYREDYNKTEPPFKQGKWGPRLKFVLDLFCFIVVFSSVDHLVEDCGPKTFFDMRETVIEGLPSRQMMRDLGSGFREQYCVNNRDAQGSEICVDTLETAFQSDVWSLLTTLDDIQDDYSGSDSEGDDSEDVAQDYSKQSGVVSKKAGDAKYGPLHRMYQATGEEWKRMLNARDDEYLRASISIDSYNSLVGDPTSHLIDTVREKLWLLGVAGFCFAGLYWLDIPLRQI